MHKYMFIQCTKLYNQQGWDQLTKESGVDKSRKQEDNCIIARCDAKGLWLKFIFIELNYIFIIAHVITIQY